MKRRFPLIAALLSFSLCFLSACSRNDTKTEDPKDKSSSEEKVESEETTEAEPEPAKTPEPEPPRFTVEAVLSGDPASIDLAALHLSVSENILVRTERSLRPLCRERRSPCTFFSIRSITTGSAAGSACRTERCWKSGSLSRSGLSPC